MQVNYGVFITSCQIKCQNVSFQAVYLSTKKNKGGWRFICWPAAKYIQCHIIENHVQTDKYCTFRSITQRKKLVLISVPVPQNIWDDESIHIEPQFLMLIGFYQLRGCWWVRLSTLSSSQRSLTISVIASFSGEWGENQLGTLNVRPTDRTGKQTDRKWKCPFQTRITWRSGDGSRRVVCGVWR